MTARPRPFVFSGIVTACFAALMMGLLVRFSGGEPWMPMARGAAALLAALAAVATEALWRPRPWAYRATAVLALAHTIAAFAVFMAVEGVQGIGYAGGYLFFTGLVVVPILANVYQDSAAAYGPGWQRRRVQLPPPPSTAPRP